jgi:hypothetical protein
MVQQAATEALQQRLVAALRCRAPQEVNHSPLFRGRFGDKSLGGVSESSSTWVNKQLVFAGNLSLDNNGGFVSCFGPVDEKLPSLMNASSAIRIRATGDGKTYLFQLRGNDGTNYVQRFTSTAKKNQVYVLPLSDFTAVDWRLTEIADAPAMNTNNIYQMGITSIDITRQSSL